MSFISIVALFFFINIKFDVLLVFTFIVCINVYSINKAAFVTNCTRKLFFMVILILKQQEVNRSLVFYVAKHCLKLYVYCELGLKTRPKCDNFV